MLGLHHKPRAQFKQHIKARFENYFANNVADELKRGVKFDDIKEDS